MWLFAGAMAVLAASLFSLAPMLRLPVERLRASLSEGGRDAGGRGLLAKSFWRLLHVELGSNPDHVAMLNVGLPDAEFSKEGKQGEFVKTALDRVRMLPGVESAAVTTVPPVTCNCNTDWIRLVGRPYNGVHNEVNDPQVSAGFFHTLEAQLGQGRWFIETDDTSHPKVVVINIRPMHSSTRWCRIVRYLIA